MATYPVRSASYASKELAEACGGGAARPARCVTERSSTSSSGLLHLTLRNARLLAGSFQGSGATNACDERGNPPRFRVSPPKTENRGSSAESGDDRHCDQVFQHGHQFLIELQNHPPNHLAPPRTVHGVV
jgi:hypothetical protein